VCVWAHGEGWGQRASRGVWGPRDTGAGRAPRHAGVAWGRSSPRTDLDNPSGARIGGERGGCGCGRHLARGPGRNPLPRGRRGTGRDATSREEGAVWRSGVLQLEEARPLSCGQHTPGGRPKISRSGPARELSVQISGRSDSVEGEAFPQWFSQPPYHFFELFALEGFIGLAHLGWLLWPPAFRFDRGFWRVGTPSPSPFDKTNSALDYDSPLGFAVILSSRWGKAGLWDDFRGSSFDGPS